MELDKLSTASSVGAAERRPLLKALVFERRTLFGCTLAVGISSVLWIVAVCTENWCNIHGGKGIFIPQTKRYFMYGNSGIWRTCRHVWVPLNSIEITNLTAVANAAVNLTGTTGLKTSTATVAPITVYDPPAPGAKLLTKCTNFLSQELESGKAKDLAYSADVAAFCRTMLSFGIIGLLVMFMGFGFSLYTFKNPRYMFKRLAAGIHFISTSCTMVVVQVLMSAIDLERKTIPFIYPPGAYHTYGPSYFLAWFVMFVNFFAFAAFLWYSKKRKGDKAATEELAMADEPTIIGR